MRSSKRNPIWVFWPLCVFVKGRTWPASSVPSRWGLTPTPAAWRFWTTRWRSREAWREWRTSWRCWQTPSPFCHDDSRPPPPSWCPKPWCPSCNIRRSSVFTSSVLYIRFSKVSKDVQRPRRGFGSIRKKRWGLFSAAFKGKMCRSVFKALFSRYVTSVFWVLTLSFAQLFLQFLSGSVNELYKRNNNKNTLSMWCIVDYCLSKQNPSYNKESHIKFSAVMFKLFMILMLTDQLLMMFEHIDGLLLSATRGGRPAGRPAGFKNHISYFLSLLKGIHRLNVLLLCGTTISCFAVL